MATTAYTIYSHYDPVDREQLERETGQLAENNDDDAWQLEAAKVYKRKQPLPPPRFVPASSTSSLSVDDWSTPGAGSSRLSSGPSSSNEVSGWYRSVISSANVKDTEATSSHSHSPSQRSSQASATTVRNKPFISKNDWFIQKVLASESSSQTRPAIATASPSLADILARNPLPAPNEDPFKPPVFVAIGPSNKGFAMLQNSGWNEGEALGQDVVRRRRIQRGDPSPWVKREEEKEETVVEVPLGDGDGEITEIRKIPIIDLTASDSKSDSEPEDDSTTDNLVTLRDKQQQVSSASGRKALLTPLPTVLKSDRLGIGLKAKTAGPYKESIKRVTHNAAALAAHFRRAEEARARKERWGKGRRGFARRDQEEQMSRRSMLSYMNS
ncbi:MAG: hypothetical protein NXY57DRAFT_999365 [Lentinula lateritia]|uniref:G-patch domain-containing protein n=1 Tax=Lentinula lateritia TaxID=40482 RepID=A0ABQ8V0N0_9AGAR|nr:MAG: hypothetical protein NXY57DRAFT_999365 [Lentinula lateritia]KAJ4468100.1 hypothetical protein C8R41DRAFT_854602 [Lentinula lateritia]